jgi:hypothetical protein
MGKVYDGIDQRWADFINQQKMFFVGTAPLSGDGHVNLSPKGYDSFRILGPTTVAYLDLGGSGVETISHLRENGRITFMFCAFDGAAKILRLYGKGTATCFDDPGFEEKRKIFPDASGVRSVITVVVDRIQDSCGWSIPFYEFKSERDQLQRYHESFEESDGRDRRYGKNVQSIDGLPGLIKPETTK